MVKDILYPISGCGPLVVLIKRDFHLVAYNESGQELAPLAALEEIGYTSTDGINQLTAVKVFPEKKYVPGKRSAAERELREVQDAQLALELERYLHGVERSFLIEELRPAWYPVKMLADVLRHRAELELPDIQLVQLAADLVAHADHHLRLKLEDSELCLPSLNLTINEDAANPSVPATRLVLEYFEQSMAAFAKTHTAAVESRVVQLAAG